jgi:N-acetylneuraminic acid mutarotase
LASLPIAAIAGGVTFEINNKIYYCTGRTSWLTANSFTQYVLEYDISKGQWSRKNDFPGTARNNAVCFTINGEAFVGLGTITEYSTFANDFWKYNPENDHWTKISNFPGLARKAGAAFAYNGKGYVMMGSGNNFYKDSWVYSPDTDKWDTLAPFPDEGRNDLHIARQNNNVYIYYSTRQSFDSNQIWKFDLTENTWKYMGLFNNCAIVSFFATEYSRIHQPW